MVPHLLLVCMQAEDEDLQDILGDMDDEELGLDPTLGEEEDQDQDLAAGLGSDGEGDSDGAEEGGDGDGEEEEEEEGAGEGAKQGRKAKKGTFKELRSKLRELTKAEKANAREAKDGKDGAKVRPITDKRSRPLCAALVNTYSIADQHPRSLYAALWMLAQFSGC